ncbi:hypothetical protein GF389_01670 [Candidatus Dojkabacteria bacterium]|nr:hypothetical protein [Candidatus Dojkabacteria bacterium]
MTKFAIFAHARSGSTSLAQVLAASPDVNMTIEPFHPDYSKWNPEEPNYSSIIKDTDSMNKALDEIYSKFNAIKVLQYQFPDEIYLELLKRREIKIIFLRRKDFLNGVISGLIAEQTNVWKKEDAKGEINYSKLKPLNVKQAKKMLDYVSEQMEFYENFLEKNRKGDYFKQYYEDLYSENQQENIQTVKRICDFLGIRLPSEDVIAKNMIPSQAQINANGDYRKIPNYNEFVDALS